MSSYFYGTLYKKENGHWVSIKRNIDMNGVKNFLDGWNIDADAIDGDKEISDLHKNVDFFYSYNYEGSVSKKDVADILLGDELEDAINAGIEYSSKAYCSNAAGDSRPIIVESKEPFAGKFIDIDFNEWVKLSDKEKKARASENYAIYTKHKKIYNGDFYGSNSFDRAIKSAENKLKEIENRKAEWEKIRTSIDYLKLSSEEKENVFDSYRYDIEDEDNCYNYMLYSARQLKETLELFSDYEEPAVFYIYNGDNYSE